MVVHEPDDAFAQLLAQRTRPDDWKNPGPAECYDLLVIGGGPAGLVAASGAAAVGARVALVEKHRLGGDCLHFGCVPSKSLRAAARRVSSSWGISLAGWTLDGVAIMSRVRQIRAAMSEADSAQRLQEKGIDLYFGEGRFVTPESFLVDGRTIRFRRAIVATGSRPALPQILGMSPHTVLTSESIFHLTTVPRRLLVLGGGPMGCELAQAFARLGCEVQMVSRTDRILPREEPQGAAILQRSLEQDGVRFCMGAEALAVEDEGRLVIRQAKGKTDTLVADAILAATGRTPNVEHLGLEQAGIAYTSDGIKVDDYLRTTNRRVFAAGDVCSAHRYTHAADALARVAVRNALFFGKQRVRDLVIPHCTYTDPEVASVGLTSESAKAQGMEITTLSLDLRHVDRCVLDGEAEGFAMIHLRRGTGRIVGATLVAPRAGETIAEVVLAMQNGIGLARLGESIRPYPTQSEVWRKLSDEYQRRRLTPKARRLIQGVLALRRLLG